MPIDPNIPLSGNALAPVQLPDFNAMTQTRTAGLENMYKIERQRSEDAAAQAKAQQEALVEALAPAYSAAFKGGGTKEALMAGFSLLPPEIQSAVRPQIDKMLALASDDQRLNALEGTLTTSEPGRAILSRIMTPQQSATLGIQQEQNALRRQELGLQQQKFEAEQQAQGAVASGDAPPVQLQKGEVWNPEKQRVETVPGTKLYNETAKKHSADYKGATAVADRTSEAVSKLDYILDPKNRDGFEYNFGGYYAAYVGQNMPVEAAQNVKAKLDSLKADLKNAGLELLRTGGSIGQITEREWPIIEQQLASLTPYIGEQEAEDVLKNIRARLQNIASRATEAYDTQWGDTQFYKPVEAKKPGAEAASSGGGGGGGGGISEGTTATNPQTGERVIYRNGQWQPL